MLTRDTRVLEPSYGDGSFLVPLIARLEALHDGPPEVRLKETLSANLFGCEIDSELQERALARVEEQFGPLPQDHNLVRADYFAHEFHSSDLSIDPERGVVDTAVRFDIIVGNPPFGGTIDPALQDDLDRRYGIWNGHKVKKETYAFFIMRALEQLRAGGRLLFICSDTFLTIPTMTGLRKRLMTEGRVQLERLSSFSNETQYPMVVLDFVKSGPAESVLVDDRKVPVHEIELTRNYSWQVSSEFAKYFRGPTLSEFVVCSSGMTTGNNDLFVRPIEAAYWIEEPFEFRFEDIPVTVEDELRKARLNRLSTRKIEELKAREAAGERIRILRWQSLESPMRIRLPNSDYRYYNKAAPGLIFAPPTSAIYWRNDGEAVLTYKKTGNWYLRGVGGQPFFGREGLTWPLISGHLNMKYLPTGYILDSGAPCAFLRTGVDDDELLFILGWTCSDLCSDILKTVLNHTKNIQSKDVERLPYPFWVSAERKQRATAHAKGLLGAAQQRGRPYSRKDLEIQRLNELYEWNE